MFTRQDLRAYAPSAFATEAAPTVSSRYGFISTVDVLDVLEESGYIPVSAKQNRTRKRDPLFTTHAVVLRHESVIDKKEGEVQQLLLRNSHNGSQSLELRFGLYRFVCANGLVVGKSVAEEKIRHTVSLAAAVGESVDRIISKTDAVFSVIERMKLTDLTAEQRLEFAKEAAAFRFGAAQKTEMDFGSIIEARRVEDEGESLWKTFNVVQESLSQGLARGKTRRGSTINVRPIDSIHNTMDFNEKLWDLAEAYI
jgi:hypothetical protein